MREQKLTALNYNSLPFINSFNFSASYCFELVTRMCQRSVITTELDRIKNTNSK